MADDDEPKMRRIVRGTAQLLAVTGLRRSRLKQLIALGQFPAPVPLGTRSVGYFEDEIAAWQAERAAARATRTPGKFQGDKPAPVEPAQPVARKRRTGAAS